jgi:hypothetical protein
MWLAVAVAREEFGSGEKGKCLPLEAVTGGLMKTQPTEKISAYCSELQSV